jgi:hypothetical protein
MSTLKFDDEKRSVRGLVVRIASLGTRTIVRMSTSVRRVFGKASSTLVNQCAVGRPILIICCVGVIMPDLLLHAVYGSSSPYLAVAVSLQLLMVAGVLDYVAEMISKTLLGVQSGKLAFLFNVAALVAALALILALIEPLGVLGACLALLVANLVRLLGAGVAIAWPIGREPPEEPIELPSITGAGKISQDIAASGGRHAGREARQAG